VGRGERVLFVHGASHETNLLSTALGKPPRFVTSISGVESRYTDRETLEIFCMAYAGKMNKLFVERLQQLGVNAVGLSGVDGRSMEGERKVAIKVIENGKRKVLRDDFTGRVEQINTGLLTLLLEHGYMPVLCPPAISYESEIINVDGDRAAAVLAAAFKAETLIILSNVPGLLRDVHDASSLIRRIDKAHLPSYMDFAQGRMKHKMMGVAEALAQGVGTVILGDARVEQPIQQALQGQGTVIR
jgi:acetylglutamate/LysW-gamma-L-alpha-aminoadipate kinase